MVNQTLSDVLDKDSKNKRESKRILIIDFCNFEDYPIGGYLSFVQNMMVSFENEVALVGITTEKNEPIGQWFKKKINGIMFDFFAYAYYSKSKTKHLIPDRLASYFLIKYYKDKIKAINIPNIFIQRQEVLMALRELQSFNVCFCFAGLENPLAISKYWYSNYIAKNFEQIFFKRLVNVDVILASGDEISIKDMIFRSKELIISSFVTQFPSRINTDIFRPRIKSEVRIQLRMPSESLIIVTTGRLGWAKGWKFMIDCFCLFETIKPGSLFYFIGEGEDLGKINDYIDLKGKAGKIILAGKKNADEVALFLNAADLFIMGSYKEGWSTSLIEAIACGTPGCVTNFSSAKQIIIEGKNGYVIDEHNSDIFVTGMLSAIELKKPVFNENIQAYSASKLKDDLLKTWKLL